MRCVVIRELCRNMVLAVVNSPATFILLWTVTGPTVDAPERTEAPLTTFILERIM